MRGSSEVAKRVIVTGATGFVGKAIVQELVDAGNQVVCIGGKNSVFEEPVFSDTEFCRAVDISDVDSMTSLEGIGEIDSVVHSAGIAHRFGVVRPEDYHSVNVIGTRNICLLAGRLGAKRFVMISTVLVYGAKSISVMPVTEQDVCDPVDDYSRSKLEAEEIAEQVCREQGIALTVLRAAPVVGEGGKGNFERLIISIDRERFVMAGSGKNRKSIIYVGDVALAVAAVLSKRKGQHEVFNIAAPPIRVGEIVSEISGALDRKVRKLHIATAVLKRLVNLAIRIGFGPTRLLRSVDTFLSESVYSAEKIEQVYSFSPKTTPKEALRKQVEWYLDNK
jgi:UDP-glucose 4-epimerase